MSDERTGTVLPEASPMAGAPSSLDWMKPWEPPQVFDEYQLVCRLGRGSMGEVYLAKDTLLDRHVAVKFIFPLNHPRARARFLTEARAVARLQHPHVVTIYRVGEVAGRPFIVSEFVAGTTLSALAKPISEQEALRIALDLTRGLAAAHRRGVLHRDVKPQNAIRSAEGVTKLLDFGIAKLLGESRDPAREDAPAVLGTDPGLTPSSAASDTEPGLPPGVSPETTSGTILGTPLYLAPECWRGEPATPASDLYSLGALLYELVSGAPPHDAANPMVLGARVMRNDAAPLATVAPEVDPNLAGLIDRCVARDPGKRFDSADALCAALEALVGRGRTPPIPAGNPYRGLFAFQPEHQAVFFGREAECRTLTERLRSEGFVLVAGDSGVGKSSLCRAAVLPALARGALAEPSEWCIASLVPGRKPMSALGAAVAAATGADLALVQRRLGAGTGIATALRDLAAGRGIALFVDQLEELVALSDPEEAARVSDFIGQLATPMPGLRVIATVRSDFLTRVAAFPGIRDVISRALFLLPPLTKDGVREAITGPAGLKGFRFESPAMVDALAGSAAAPASLPLLQFTLAALWEARDVTRKVIAARTLEKMGGVEGALARHADAVLGGLRPGQRAIARGLLTQMVSSTQTRIARTASELIADAPERHEVLEVLVRGRLVAALDGGEEPSYQLAHEALIGGWRTLEGWLKDDSALRLRRDRLRAAAAEWQRLGRSNAMLWAPVQLQEVVGIDETALEVRVRRFLAASRRAVKLKRRKWQALTLAAVAAVAVTYGLVRYQASRTTRAKVTARLAQATALLRDARAANAEVEKGRAAAFRDFDQGRREQGEQGWRQTREQARAVERSYLQATGLLEQTRVLDPAHPGLRELLADALFERALVARRDHRQDQLDDLLARLESVDVGARRRQRLAEPATVSVVVRPEGATIALARYERDGLRRVPRAVESPGSWSQLRLEAGSYRLTVTAAGHAAVQYPFVVEPGETRSIELSLPDAEAVPPAFVYVPAGRFSFGSFADDEFRRVFFTAPPVHDATTDPYLVARHETTFGEWIEFLESLPAEERARRLPRPGNWGIVKLDRLGPRDYKLTLTPATTSHEATMREPIRYPGRSRREVQDWLRFPVSGISVEDAAAYTRWLDSTGRVPGARLCTDPEWERAARGADDRLYPHGDALAPDDANFQATYGDLLSGPDAVGSHPASESPFGVHDMTGNALEFVREAGGESVVVRGGGFSFDAIVNQLVNRTPADSGFVGLFVGFRVCADPPRGSAPSGSPGSGVN